MSLKGCRILIVDDEEDLLQMVAEAFEELNKIYIMFFLFKKGA